MSRGESRRTNNKQHKKTRQNERQEIFGCVCVCVCKRQGRKCKNEKPIPTTEGSPVNETTKIPVMNEL